MSLEKKFLKVRQGQQAPAYNLYMDTTDRMLWYKVDNKAWKELNTGTGLFDANGKFIGIT